MARNAFWYMYHLSKEKLLSGIIEYQILNGEKIVIYQAPLSDADILMEAY